MIAYLKPFIVASTMMAATCGPDIVPVKAPSVDAPTFTKFPDSQINMNVLGSREEVLRSMSDYFSGRNWPTRQEIQEPYIYLVTTYWTDTSGKRQHRAAYRIRIGRDTEKQACSNASLSWIVESRSFREQSWRSTDDDSSYQPKDIQQITEMIKERGTCK
jgi:hypothetical protein